jgi:hypothetical protein
MAAETPYKCPFAFESDLARYSWSIVFFTDVSMKDNKQTLRYREPYYFELAASTNQAFGCVNPTV